MIVSKFTIMQAFLRSFVASKGFTRVMILRERTEIPFPILRPIINPTAGVVQLWYKAHSLSGPCGSIQLV